MGESIQYIFLVVFVILTVLCLPLGLIWAINVLFDLSNPYDLYHWSAAFFILATVGITGAKRTPNQ